MVQVQAPPDKLTYSVVLDKWTAVNKAMKEFKKKRNAAFYLEIEELTEGPNATKFQVRVFKRSG